MTITEIKQRNREAGQHFFDADTMRFFNSTVYPEVVGDGYFITSERFESTPEYPPLFTVRHMTADGHIEDIGGFQAYETYAGAFTAAQKAAHTGRVA